MRFVRRSYSTSFVSLFKKWKTAFKLLNEYINKITLLLLFLPCEIKENMDYIKYVYNYLPRNVLTLRTLKKPLADALKWFLSEINFWIWIWVWINFPFHLYALRFHTRVILVWNSVPSRTLFTSLIPSERATTTTEATAKKNTKQTMASVRLQFVRNAQLICL